MQGADRATVVPPLKARLRGVLAFPITPFTTDGAVDIAAVETNASWLSGSGVAGLVAPSGTGEFFALSPDEIIAVTEATVRATAGRIPVIASVGFGPRMAADLATRAENVGASGVLVLPPYYAQPDPASLLGYYDTVARATSLPLIPYQRDGTIFSPDLLEELVNAIPTLIAFKDGRGDLRLFQRLRDRITERLGATRLVWLAGAGDDLAGPYYAAGAEGFTSSLACFWPEAAVEIERLARTGDFTALRAYQSEFVHPLYEFRQRRSGFEVSVMKAAMELLGHPAGAARAPLANLTRSECAELSEVLIALRVPTARQRSARGNGHDPESARLISRA